MTNSKKLSTRKLNLNKETLRHLESNTLRQVAGGLRCTLGGDSCTTAPAETANCLTYDQTCACP
jgi:hypothetical protein